jgi:hypothetical protein
MTTLQMYRKLMYRNTWLKLCQHCVVASSFCVFPTASIFFPATTSSSPPPTPSFRVSFQCRLVYLNCSGVCPPPSIASSHVERAPLPLQNNFPAGALHPPRRRSTHPGASQSIHFPITFSGGWEHVVREEKVMGLFPTALEIYLCLSTYLEVGWLGGCVVSFTFASRVPASLKPGRYRISILRRVTRRREFRQ